MAIDTPTWLQNGSYSARLDRIFSDIMFTEGVLRPGVGQFAVGPSSPTAMSVTIAAGYACVQGDDQADQGKYLVRSTAVETRSITAAPGSGSRIDLVCLRINDPDAGGPAGNNATLVVVPGTPSGSPVPPATPTSAIVLAEVTVAAGTTAITAGMISDVRVQAQTILANTLTNAGDLLSFDGSNTVRVGAGPSGYPLTSTGSAVQYAQLGATGLASNAVTTAKITDLNVTTGKLADLAVTTGKIADGAVTAAKLAPNVVPRVGCELTYSWGSAPSPPGTIPSWTEVTDTNGFYGSGSSVVIPAGLSGVYLISIWVDMTNYQYSYAAIFPSVVAGGISHSTGFRGSTASYGYAVGGDLAAFENGVFSQSYQQTLTAGQTISVNMGYSIGGGSVGFNSRLIVTRIAG